MSAPPLSRSLFDRLGEKPVVRVAAYYVLLFSGAALLGEFVPAFRRLLDANDYGAVATGASLFEPSVVQIPTGAAAALAALAGGIGAVLLMLPVAWVYVLTRARRGYRQSLVQTLLILPIVVAGVVAIVKYSVALAFGLAGIVAAVSFRNRLEDSKDAVYVFLAIAVGLACGVQAVGVAASLSVLFNVVMLLLWWTDFGRVPAVMEGAQAERRLQRALNVANRTHQFVSLVDEEILRSLAPEQLKAVADRVAERRKAVTLAEEMPKPPRPPQRLEVTLRTGEAATHRAALESVLDALAKRWTALTPELGGDTDRLPYEVVLKRKTEPATLVERLRAAGGVATVRVDLLPPSDDVRP